MKFLSNLDSRPWQSEGAEQTKRCVLAAGLLSFAIFGMPVIASKLFGDRLSVPDILIFSSMPGVCAYGFFTASRLPLKPLTLKEIFALTGSALLLSFAAGIVTLIWKFLLNALGGLNVAEKQFAMELISRAGGSDAIKLFFALCVFAPIAEELLFRRIVYGMFLRFGMATAMLVTSLLFSICHFFAAGLPGLFILGLCFQIAYLKYRNLTAPVLLHAAVNSIAFVCTYFQLS